MQNLNLHDLIASGDPNKIRALLKNWTPFMIAFAIKDMESVEKAVVIRILPSKTASETFNYLDKWSQEQLLRAMGQEEVAKILNSMASDDRTELLEELPAEITKMLLALLSKEERQVAIKLLGYPKGSIGRLMTSDYIAIKMNWTVQAVLDYVRDHGQDSETLSVVYVVDDNGILIDDIRIRELLLAPLNKQISELADHHFVALKAIDAEQTAINVFLTEDRKALPVTDTKGVLIGIVTIDDVLKISEEQATKNIQKIGGVEVLDEPYMSMGFLRLVKKRASWLVILFIGEMLTASAMGFFEVEIAKAVVLALFVPLIISSGGNAGSQATTLVIRALSLKELTLFDWFRVMRREIFIGLALGAILGTIGFMRISVWAGFSNIYGPHWLLIAVTVGVALIGVVMWGSLIGSMLPFILRRLGLDPATSSAPFVATLVDVTGLVIYFSIALVFLRGTLL